MAESKTNENVVKMTETDAATVIAMRLKSAESCTPSSPNWMTTPERDGAAAATPMDFQRTNSIIESEHFGY